MLNPDTPSEPEKKEAPPESLKDPQKTEEPKAECSTPETGTSEKAVIAETGPVEVEDCSRERLKRHRTEMAGQVCIPETWGQESLLKGWVKCSDLDTSLVPKGLRSAREALVHDSRGVNSSELRVENRLLCPWVGFNQGMEFFVLKHVWSSHKPRRRALLNGKTLLHTILVRTPNSALNQEMEIFL